MAKLFTQSGKIEESNLHNVIDCLDPSLIQELTACRLPLKPAIKRRALFRQSDKPTMVEGMGAQAPVLSPRVKG